MKLNRSCLENRTMWEQAQVALPEFDWNQMCKKTEEAPVWVHFGAGNIFRGFIAVLQQRLLNEGLAESGIIAADTFDYDIIDDIYRPHDGMTLMVSLKPDGTMEREVIASVARGVCANVEDAEEFGYLKGVFANPSLQMVSFTITEKGYALADLQGNYVPVVKADLEGGPEKARHAMSIVTALLLERYRHGGAPIAVVSMDNCSHNGEKLRSSIVTVAEEWGKRGHGDDGFLAWLKDEAQVSFPWSMIDKITPRPAQVVQEALEAAGIEEMAPIITSKHTYIAPFVNAEVPQYLVVEDRFPNGRPCLEKAGVYLTDRETVNMTERMKVTTCLNPLHTALAVYGCLLGYTSIAAEMKDEDLKKLVEAIGYVEGMPVVTDPGILSPMDFIHEVIDSRLPNPFIPDAPQRIATDTSQKIPIRFGETIKAYQNREDLDVGDLTAIPLTLAGWLRYLLAVDDEGHAMEVSSDPMLSELQKQLEGITLGNPASCEGKLEAILANEVLFGLDLVKAGLAETMEGMLKELLEGPGAVRKTLHRYMES